LGESWGLGYLAAMMAESNKQGSGCSRCAELEARVAALEAALAAAQKNSGNSSKPPSSDITSPPPKTQKPARRKKRKRGGQPGHRRHQRVLLDEHEVDRSWDWRFDACPCCQGALRDADEPPKRFQQIEVLPQPVQVEEHRRVGQWCENCQKLLYPALPDELTKAGLIGPRLTALVGWLHGVCHMSVSSIRKYFRDVLGIRISRGMLSKVLRKVSESLADPYDELLRVLADEDRLNVDETGHKENGRRLWTWCFRAPLYTVFKISPSRGSDVLIEVLGREFDGLLGCDYFSAYRKYMRLNENVGLQFCLAHLIRDVKFLAEHPDPRNREYGKRLRELLRKLFHTIHRRDEYACEATYRQALDRLRSEFCWQAGMEVVDTKQAANLAERFYRHAESYFRFITEPDLAPTNNFAEQAIRFVAIHRRLTQGTRSDAGRRWFERICTVAVTCEQQSRSAFEFLHQSILAFFSNGHPPSLLPVPAD
jgi:transposase